MKVKTLSRAALFIALMAMSSYIKIPLGFVPITLQTLVVLLIGLMLNTKEAVFCIVTYVIMGLLGIPVFSGGGGISYVFSPTFGYIIGFVCAVIFLRLTSKFPSIILRCVSAVLIIYSLGILYFVVLQYSIYGITYTVTWIITSLFLVYLPSDILSCFLAKWIFSRLQYRMK